MTDIMLHKIRSAIEECDAHAKRLSSAKDYLSELFPMTAASFEQLADEQVAVLDQFIYRFTKLQDAVGLRLFPSIIPVVTGNDEVRPFLDALHELEKAGVIESVGQWQELRVLRNNLAHEYPDSKEQNLITLNQLYEQGDKLRTIYLNAKRYAEEKLIPLLTNG
jgi:hypothetical protein